MLFDDPVRKGKKLSSTKLNKSHQNELSNREHGELVFKVASNIKGDNPSNSLDYITHNNEKEYSEEQFIAPENEMGDQLSKADLEKLKAEWKKEFSDDKKINSRNMTHFIFSIDVEKTNDNENKFDNAARDFLQKRFGDEGFRYVYTQHKDTEHPHIHVIVNNNNLETNKKLRISPEWHRETRFMAKAHLENHGIKQSATFKKDRQYLEQVVKNVDKSYKECNNWFEAKLKSNAKNDEHFQQLKKQWVIVQELKNEVKESNRILPQERIALGTELKQLRKDMITFDRFNSRTEANKALTDMIKKVDPEKSVIDRALNRSKELTAKEQSKEKRQLYFHAVELVKGEAILNTSKEISSSDKKPILKNIKERRVYLESKGIDVKSIERDYQVQLSEKKPFVAAYKELKKTDRTTNKELNKAGYLDSEKTEKKVIRVLNNLNSAKTIELTPKESKLLNETKELVFQNLKARGVDVQKIEVQHKEARAFKDQVQMVKNALSKPLDSKETELVQSKVFELKERLKSPPKQLNQKEIYAINTSLKTSQDKLNLVTKNQFMQVNKEIINIEKNIPTLNNKIIDDPVKAKKQAYAIAKKLVVILNHNNNVTPSQKMELNKRLEPIKVTLAKSGVNLNEVMNKRIKTNETDLKLNEVKELTMPRVRNIGFDRIEKQVKDLSNEIKQSDHTRDNKRELSKQLKSKESEILSVRQSDTIDLTETIKKLIKSKKKLMSVPNQVIQHH